MFFYKSYFKRTGVASEKDSDPCRVCKGNVSVYLEKKVVKLFFVPVFVSKEYYRKVCNDCGKAYSPVKA